MDGTSITFGEGSKAILVIIKSTCQLPQYVGYCSNLVQLAGDFFYIRTIFIFLAECVLMHMVSFCRLRVVSSFPLGDRRESNIER